MVFYFVCAVVEPPMTIYMGLDKYENEELLKWGFPEDVWFHVDKLSSAHVYLRLPMGMTVEAIPPEVVSDCAQLVKANSIQGCKINNVSVVYTPFSNLKKTAGMDVGQVGFHNSRKVHTVMVEKKLGDVVNRLNKTKREAHPDLRAEREERDRQERIEQKSAKEEERQRKREEEDRLMREAEVKSYKSVMTDDQMKTNKYDEEVDFRAVEDDFM
ncbi:coiled-coil domain-containing protein 25-like [Halichondria panicea]|uniref:coiled-coil domain-containing protein 25-like n=1 Tax=Halichondria panicea TaxID=6063 RepID=UPI00312B4CA2